MPGRVLSEPEVQPAEVRARVAPAGVSAGRVPATKVAASGVAASTSVLASAGTRRQITDSKIGRTRGDRTRKAIRVAMAFPPQGI